MSFAILRNNKVVQIVDEFPEYYTEMVVDITNMVPVPRVSWILLGNKLVANITTMTLSELKLEQQIQQQYFGMSLALSLVNMIGGRNLLLIEQGTAVNVSALLTSLGTVKSLLETGALKTARSFINAVYSDFPLYSDIMTHALDKINLFLHDNGYE